jgi:hypothetical protein
MDDAMIAAFILAKYMVIGVVPVIVPTVTSFMRSPLEGTWQQTGTDRVNLLKLAANHGYVFYVKPGPVALSNTAYWGPPPRLDSPQKALSVNMGPQTNINSISFNYDGLAPMGVVGAIQDPETEIDVPIIIETSMRVPPFASQPALTSQAIMKQCLYSHAIMGSNGYQRAISAIDAFASAQSITDQSTDQVVRAEGELDALRYGDLLDAPGVVDLRGAGYSYDGTYYVKSVTHSISKEKYTQKFTLTREGLGSTITEVQT